MPAATDFDAKAALVAAIETIETLGDALVREGLPLDIPNEPERVYVYRNTENGRREPHLQSRIWKEIYDLRVLIEIRKYGADDPDGAATSERLRDVRNAIEAALDADDTLDGVVTQAAVTAWDTEVGASADDDGWIGRTLLTVTTGAIVG